MNDKFRKSHLLSTMVVGLMVSSVWGDLPEGFGYCQEVIPSLKLEMRYASDDNFTGQPVPGYIRPVCILSLPALQQLAQVQEALQPHGLGLKIFDGYRPQKAVDRFVQWSEQADVADSKQKYYPTVDKTALFEQEYIAAKSGHSRGSTVDLTIIDLATEDELDCGTVFDFFGEPSHALYENLSKEQRANRALLRHLMIAHGFLPYPYEWWHFTLKGEPFPDTYFNFDVQ